MTLTQLAKLAHVSVSTASKAFSMSPEVNEQTREMIFALAKENGCFKRYYNAAYPKLVVAVICSAFNSNTFMLTTLQERLAEHNCDISVASSKFSAERELELIRYYSHYAKVDGIILISPHCVLPENAEAPIAVIDSYNPTPEGVITAERSIDKAYRDSIMHFYSKGIRDICYVGDKMAHSRLELYRRFMAETVGEVNEDLISLTSATGDPKGGEEAMNVLFDRLGNKGVRAVISSYFSVTLGATRAIKARGLSIPEDVAIITFSDDNAMGYSDPPMTGIEILDTECAIRTADALINRISDKPHEQHIRLESKVIFRRSSEID